MRRIALLTLVLALFVPGPSPRARMNPLRVLTSQTVRPEILFVLDTSEDMREDPTSSTHRGSDCTAHDATVDLCGDGLCSGNETPSGCSSDCKEIDDESSDVTKRALAGSPSPCESTAADSRLALTKRALRNFLPTLRPASVGLIGYRQQGYWQVYPTACGQSSCGTSTCTCTKVTIFLTERELRSSTSWTGGTGWNSSANAPATSFSRSSTLYTLLSGAGLTRTEDSLYRRDTGTGYVYKRITWASAGGRVHNDGTYDWDYLGSYYTYSAPPRSTATALWYTTAYYGPQFGSSTTYHLRRFNGADDDQNMDTSTGIPTMWLLEPLANATSTSTQSFFDDKLGRVQVWLNRATNGGIHAGTNDAAIAEGLAVARTQFSDRTAGTGTYAGNPDTAAACRPRVAVVLAGHENETSSDPATAVTNLYNLSATNPVKTYVVALPGTSSSALTALDALADLGDDGQANSSATARVTTTEAELVAALQTIADSVLITDYTTTQAAGVATSSGSSVQGNLALVPSTQYPNWKGVLRAYNLLKASTDPDFLAWEAGAVLAARSTDRILYTGPYSATATTPVPVLCSGVPNVTGGCGPSNVKAVWSRVATPPSDAEITATIRYIAQKKIGPFANSVPAVVGAPPRYSDSGLAGHDTFETTYANRESLAYVASNDGVLHAFRISDGSEAFGYIPPDAWPKIYALYKAGGQEVDPTQVRWILANSPRVEDVKATSSSSWATQLVQTYGPGGDQFVVLDVTNPSTCTSGVCTLNDPPFTTKAYSRDLGTSVTNVIAQTWSLPSFFFVKTGANTLSAAAYASGYVPPATSGTDERYYVFQTTLWSAVSSYALAPGTGSEVPKVDYGVVADTVAITNPDSERQVVAAYQADPNGRLTRFPAAATSPSSKVKTLLSGTAEGAGAAHPFILAPAAIYRGSNRATFAITSGAYQEEGAWMTNASFESKIWMRTDDDGTLQSTDNFTCAVSQICSSACYNGGTLPSSCTPPSARALPVSSPILIENRLNSANIEGFFLYFDPPTAQCSGNEIALGTSYVFRISTTGATQNLMKIRTYANTIASGLSIVGGGTEIVVSKSTVGTGAQATVETFSGGSVMGGSSGTPGMESWREVR